MDQVRACIVRDDGDRLVVDETHDAYPRERAGLGDMARACLSAIGITEERVSRLLGRPCNCPKRVAVLNKIGRKFGIG